MVLEDIGATCPELLLAGAIFIVFLGNSNWENPFKEQKNRKI